MSDGVRAGNNGRQIASIFQATTGLCVFGFSLVHVGGHALAPVSLGVSNAALFALREAVQNPVVEGALFAAISSHAALGLLKRRWWRSRPDKWFTYSGLFLAAAIPFHLAATRLIPAAYSTHVDLAFVAQGMNVFHSRPILSTLFYPYYVLLGSAGLYHGILGTAKSLRLLRVPDWIPSSLRYMERNKVALGGVLLAWMGVTVLAINGWSGSVFPLGGDRIYVSPAAARAMEVLHDNVVRILTLGWL
ncbi:hypothetical protein BC830DRAFT_1154452 [Chytriomyces sp. MP71]|nr:hypothetical protein BC830DRAFT_1154452 [Chytriomyces sp. MP71]